MVLSQEELSAMKLARIQALSKTSDLQVIENILKQEGDINYAIPSDSPYKITKPNLIGNTALHFTSTIDNIDLLKSLLNHGADFTKKNEEGQTILHMLIAKEKYFTELFDNSFMNSVLSAHVRSKNSSNPNNKDGLSHFHIACMTTNSAAVQFFLENGVLLDQPVDMDSKFYPGYTPLHFATMLTNVKAAELLIRHGANMHVVDKNGMSALHILIKRKIYMYDELNNAMYEKGDSYKKYQKQIRDNDRIMNIMLENVSSDNNCLDSIGLSNFHVACMLQDSTVAKNLINQVTDINQCVNSDSPLCPGYTALHFAAHANIKTVEILVRKGANLAAKDSKGFTPLDICCNQNKVGEICSVLSLNANYANLLFSDGQTKLIQLVHILAKKKQLKRWIDSSTTNINIRIPMDSPCWPGYTPLHFAVLFAEKQMYEDDYDEEDEERILAGKKVKQRPQKEVDLETIRFIVSQGADLSMQDSRGRTAIHLAYRLIKITVVDAILNECDKIPSVTDDEGLSHIHIVSAAHKENNLYKLDIKFLDVDLQYKGKSTIYHVRPGSTPLHVCLVYAEDDDDLENKLTILLKCGGVPYFPDAHGLTPIHRILEMCYSYGFQWEGTEPLFDELDSDFVAEKYGVSHLHVACNAHDEKAVKRLVEEGADVNLAIKCPQQIDDESLKFLTRYDKFTPLDFSLRGRTNIYKYLLKRGADVFAKNADGSTPLDDSRVLNYFVKEVKKKVKLQKRMRQEFGWTKLHLACYSLDNIRFKDLVKAEIKDINARVFANSPVWKGWTPLHMLVYHVKNYSSDGEVYAGRMSEILLQNGADVTFLDDQQNTPITMLYKMPSGILGMKEHATLLMKYHKDYKVNPINSQGLSHFHLACYLNNMDAVKGFLSHGVDVNRPIHYFADWNPGYTPLHLASQIEVVDLLINHGGDIHVENVEGRSVLAEVLKRYNFDENLATKIIEFGADINRQNFKGETPFEIAISHSVLPTELKFFIERGFIVNSCNPISGAGYLATILGKYGGDNVQSFIDMIINEKLTTFFGRTVLHHVVSGQSTRHISISIDKYVSLFERLIKGGCDIDDQDDKGCTALHLAVKYLNDKAVAGLLASGADVNVLDKKGKTPLSYLPDLPKYPSPYSTYDHEREFTKSTKKIFEAHLQKLDYLNLELCKSNADAIAGKSVRKYEGFNTFRDQILQSMKVDIGVRFIKLYQCMTEAAVMMYPSLNEFERCKINEYIDSLGYDDGTEYYGPIKLQYRKGVRRLALLPCATKSFRLLLGFDLPDLCAENIFQHLRNSDMKNIVDAENETETGYMEISLD